MASANYVPLSVEAFCVHDTTPPVIVSSTFTQPEIRVTVTESTPDQVYIVGVAAPSSPTAPQIIAGEGGGILEAVSFGYSSGYQELGLNFTDENIDEVHFVFTDLAGNVSSIQVESGVIVGSAVSFVGWGATAHTTADETSLVVPQPSGVQVGDLLFVPVSADGGPTLTGSAGWVKLGQDDQFATVTGAGFWRIADGTASDTFTLSSTVAESMVGVMGCARGVTNASMAIGSNLAYDPPSHTPASQGRLWVAAAATDNSNTLVSGPANYSDVVSDTEGGAGSRSTLAAAVRVIEAGTEDPGAFAFSISEQNVCFTIALW